MSLVYPVIVLFNEGVFFDQMPSVGNVDEFCSSFISANNLDKNNVEIYLYDRKQWISLLMDAQKEDTEFMIEKLKVKTVKKTESEEDIDVDVSWMQESELSLYYTAKEIAKIEENKEALQNYSAINEEVLSALPHVIQKKTRKAKKTVLIDVVDRELFGVPHTLQEIQNVVAEDAEPLTEEPKLTFEDFSDE